MNESPIKPAATGLIGSLLVWLADAAKWYANNLDDITKWYIHIAQIAGLVIAYYSIKILHRNLKTGRNSKNPLEQPKQ